MHFTYFTYHINFLEHIALLKHLKYNMHTLYDKLGNPDSLHLIHIERSHLVLMTYSLFSIINYLLYQT